MKSLFSKIFLCFWLSHFIAVGLTYAVLSAAQSQREAAERRRAPMSFSLALLTQHAKQAAALAETDRTPQRTAVTNYLDAVHRQRQWQSVLFNARGEVVAGRVVPRGARRLRRLAQGGEHAEILSTGEGLSGALRVLTARGTPYVFVAHLPRPRPVLRSGNRNFFEIVRLLGVLVAAGLVSYGLARYLSAPALTVRRAAHQLASGDLSVRVGEQIGTRRDEIADLGRDFDLMAERLETVMTSERRLLGDISHELRSPLARMQVALDLAAQDADETTQTHLARIERESSRLNELIGQLLTLTRLESADQRAARQKMQLDELLQEVAADADFEARSNHRQVKITGSVPCALRGNEALLRSAIENVVRNAARYTPEGAAVEIELRRETPSPKTPSTQRGAQAVITVRDYGKGVPEASLTQLFRPFYRVDDARDRQSGGMGLGLSIAQRAVVFHGGSIAAQNANPGLLMELRLPCD